MILKMRRRNPSMLISTSAAGTLLTRRITIWTLPFCWISSRLTCVPLTSSTQSPPLPLKSKSVSSLPKIVNSSQTARRASSWKISKYLKTCPSTLWILRDPWTFQSWKASKLLRTRLEPSGSVSLAVMMGQCMSTATYFWARIAQVCPRASCRIWLNRKTRYLKTLMLPLIGCIWSSIRRPMILSSRCCIQLFQTTFGPATMESSWDKRLIPNCSQILSSIYRKSQIIKALKTQVLIQIFTKICIQILELAK